jgi:hypothetical protein
MLRFLLFSHLAIGGDDLRYPGLHLQGLDQGPGHVWLPGIHCPLQVQQPVGLNGFETFCYVD